MPIETSVTHIADLEPLYPLGTDNRLQGDNHIRNIKTALKNDLPLTTPATATGIALLTAANAAAARTALGSTATGDALFTTATAATARTTLDVYSKAETDTAISGINVAQIQTLTATVAGNDLTITLAATKLDFRSATLNSGAVATVTSAAPISLVIPSGATLGTVSGGAETLAVVAVNNAGTMDVAIVNLSSGVDLSETGVINTTAKTTGSDSADVFYANSTLSNVAYRLVGFVEITETTAGTWATAPTLVQGGGGQSLTQLWSLGYGQTDTNVTGSRALSTTYTNTTGRTITVDVVVVAGGTGGGALSITKTINGTGRATSSSIYCSGAGYSTSVYFHVKPGDTYSVASTASGSLTTSIASWWEMR